MKTKEEIMKDFPKAQLASKEHFNCEDYCIWLLNLEYKVRMLLKFSEEDYMKINNVNNVNNVNLNTKDYIDIIHKAYRKNFREEFRKETEQRWRESRLRAKLAKKEVKTTIRRKI